jgi:hypothetical protein
VEQSGTSNSLDQGRRIYFETVRILSDLSSARHRVEQAMTAVTSAYKEDFPCCRLVLYAHNCGRGSPPFALHWNATVDDSREGASENPFRRSKRARNPDAQPRKLRSLGPLTRDHIYFIAKCWERRDEFWDYNRRAGALNDAMKAVSGALNPSSKSLKNRVPHHPILVKSCFSDCPDLAIPPCPKESVPVEFSSLLKDAVRSAWSVAHRVAFADREYVELVRRYSAQPILPDLALVFAEESHAPPGGSPVWIFLRTDAIAYSLSHRALRHHGVSRGPRSAVLEFESIRRKIGRSVKNLAESLKEIRERSHAAFIAVDRGLAEAQVSLPKAVRRLDPPWPPMAAV